MNEKTHQDFLDLLKKSNPRQRRTVMQRVEGKVTDGVTYIREEMNLLTPDMTARQITFLSSRECHCGQILSQENPLKGHCQHGGCNSVLCAVCARQCIRCGRSVCHRHSLLLDGNAYCRRCVPAKLAGMALKGMFRMGKKKNGRGNG